MKTIQPSDVRPRPVQAGSYSDACWEWDCPGCGKLIVGGPGDPDGGTREAIAKDPLCNTCRPLTDARLSEDVRKRRSRER